MKKFNKEKFIRNGMFVLILAFIYLASPGVTMLIQKLAKFVSKINPDWISRLLTLIFVGLLFYIRFRKLKVKEEVKNGKVNSKSSSSKSRNDLIFD